MRRFILLAIAAVLFVLCPTASTAKPVKKLTMSQQGVYMVGDSITYQGRATVLKTEVTKDWIVDGVKGRRVTALLTPRIKKTGDYNTDTRHIFRTGSIKVSTAVIALGTNATDELLTEIEARELYLAGIKTLRAEKIWKSGPKRIVLVTPWKYTEIDETWLHPSTNAPVAPYKYYDRTVPLRDAMYYLAGRYNYVCVMDWASYVERHRELLSDGVHPTASGRKVWKKMLVRAVNSCGK